MKTNVDVLVVGGGINGVGIARDAVGRGLSVMLCEKDDLASHTSSASTKLIHGGLRYLEYYEFGLVRKALQEREVLLRAAPHIISPLRFVMPHMPHLRPAWMIRLGLFLYDHLSSRDILLGSRGIQFKTHPSGQPLRELITKGFVYSDAWVDDARLVVLNAMDAQERGATILTRTKMVAAKPSEQGWQVELIDTHQRPFMIQARTIVNATGPWVSSLINESIHPKSITPRNEIRLVKGSHIVTKKLFDHDHAYIFQNPDNRIVFAIPYLHQYTLIGTTDLEYKDDPNQVTINTDEIRYLCDSVNTYFKQSIQPTDVLWDYSGVRPLLEQEDTKNASAVTRDYHLELDAPTAGAQLLSVFGGKITTFRRLAQEAVTLIQPAFANHHANWTDTAPLPGGDIANADFNSFCVKIEQSYPWLPADLARRYAGNYGTRMTTMLKQANSIADLGEELSPGLFELEAQYLVDVEWAQQADDILWRRTKLGLSATPESTQRLQQWLEHYRSRESSN